MGQLVGVDQWRLVSLARGGWYDVLRAGHPFQPGENGSQCNRVGCWGWVDDPRHSGFDRAGRRVVPALMDRKAMRRS